MKHEDIICKYCSETFHNWDIFDRHLKFAHNKVRVIICKLCQEKCKGVDEFNKHLTFVHGTTHWYVSLAMRDTNRILEDLED